MKIEWNKQRNKIPKMRFGGKEAADDERAYVVKKGEEVSCRLLSKEKIEFDDNESIHLVVSFLDDEDKKFEFFAPKMLQTLLGWTSENLGEQVADVEKNCFIKFTYLGKSKSGAHLFDKEGFRIGFEKAKQ